MYTKQLKKINLLITKFYNMKNNNNFHDHFLIKSNVGRTSNTIKSLMICTLLLLASKALAQNIITVDNNPGSTAAFTGLQAALDSASPNDIIYVQPSAISYGNIVINKAVTITGRSHSEPGKASIIGSISVRSSNVTLKGLNIFSITHATTGPNPIPFVGLSIFDCAILSSASVGVQAGVAVTTANNIILRGNLIYGNISIFNDAKNVIITNNIFAGGNPLNIYNALSTIIGNNVFRFQSNPITLNNFDPSNPAVLSNNMFIFTFASAGSASVNFNSGSYTLNNNLTYEFGGGNVSIAGNGNITQNNTLANTNPLFTNVDRLSISSFAGSSTYLPGFRLADDLSLQGASPALTGGTGGSEIGLFSNGFLYKNLGVPRGIPTLDVLSYDPSVPKNGNINVIIKAKAH